MITGHDDCWLGYCVRSALRPGVKGGGEAPLVYIIVRAEDVYYYRARALSSMYSYLKVKDDKRCSR